jgi:signal transduction histidine kinase
VIGGALALALAVAVVRLRRRLELVARAEHELRGPLTAFALGLEAARRGQPVAGVLDAELERARTALADLAAARQGRRAPAVSRRIDLERLVRSSAAAWGARVDWRAAGTLVEADAGRVAQALGNLLANAAEHGDGAIAVRAARMDAAAEIRLEVANPARGRGLSIAAAAARDTGGRLSLERGDDEFRATLDLPLAT